MVTKEQIEEDITLLRNVQDMQFLQKIHLMIQAYKEMSLVKKEPKQSISEAQQKAMDAFFGMHKDLGIENVEEELRLIRKGRRRLWDDI